MPKKYSVVDLFAGPGGLAEGFASYTDSTGNRPFKIALSVEKDAAAFQTLRLRAFLRQFGATFPSEYYAFLNGEISQPDWRLLYPREWHAAEAEALHLELGAPYANAVVFSRIEQLRARASGRTILIGGPPCQAYSLVGRARNAGNASYRPEADPRHFLYKQYIQVLARLQPAMFVMENVKGILSSRLEGRLVFDRILRDLQSAGGCANSYRLLPLSSQEDVLGGFGGAEDFVVRSEQFSVPQARHRIIVVGIRDDISRRAKPIGLKSARLPTEAGSVLAGLPRLRSGVSDAPDSYARWRTAVLQGVRKTLPAVRASDCEATRETFSSMRQEMSAFRLQQELPRFASRFRVRVGRGCPQPLADWILDPLIRLIPNHDSRAHIQGDLARYFFCASFGRVHGRSPKASEFPLSLAPLHANWHTGKFADRFRVQIADLPSSTVTSHISKDGHYFVHPDPLQCRSLTVREAARLQTFPDNYLFLGNRTQQYVQVGNAVPPFLALQIAGCIAHVLMPTRSPRVATTQTTGP